VDFYFRWHPLIESNLINNSNYTIMKNQPVVRKPETLEEILFEDRNKSYGAFELNKKSRKYLIIAFLISFAGVSTAIAVPFINSLKGPKGPRQLTDKYTGVVLTDLKDKDNVLPPPPPPPVLPENMMKLVSYEVPVVVEKAEDVNNAFNLDFISQAVNLPVDIDIEYTPPNDNVIPVEVDTVILFPQEPASFMGCMDLTCFHKWVSENIEYPAIAADAYVKGKVIVQFCVNTKGEVVDVTILKRLDPAIDAETIRVITSSPKWAPAKQGGRPVKTQFTVPFTFDLI
jgi:protein TonB